MGKQNRSIEILFMGVAIALGNITTAVAENIPDATSNRRDLTGINLKTRQRLSNLLFQTTELNRKEDLDRDDKGPAFQQQILAQTPQTQPEDATPEIIKPAQPPIPDIQPLNPSGNPLSFPTQADEVEVDAQQPITLEQAIQLSLKNNKDVQVARLEVERAESALRQERAALYPTLDLTSGLTYNDSAFFDSITQQRIEEGVPEESFQNSEDSSFTFNGGLGISYDIYDGGFRGASIRAAQKQLRSDELNLESVVEQTRLDTASDYYDLQNSDAQVEIQRAAVEDATQTLRDAQLLERAGVGTRFDILTAEVELAQARQNLTTQLANQNIARRQLAETLSVDHSTQLTTADTIEEAGTWDLELSETIVQAFKNRAELEQQLLQREINQEQRTIALSQIRPTLSATANYTANDDFEDDFDINDQYSVGLNLEWRLYDGGAARAGAEQAETDAEIAETQFADLRNQIRFAVEQAFFQLQSNQNNISTATREVELAEESLRLARLRFGAGVGTQTDVIDAQTRLTEARGNLLSSIIDYNQSYVQLQRQVSNTPDNSLQDLP